MFILECMCNCLTSAMTRCYDLGTQFLLFLSFRFLLHSRKKTSHFVLWDHWFEIQYIKHFVRLIAEFKYIQSMLEYIWAFGEDFSGLNWWVWIGLHCELHQHRQCRQGHSQARGNLCRFSLLLVEPAWQWFSHIYTYFFPEVRIGK